MALAWFTDPTFHNVEIPSNKSRETFPSPTTASCLSSVPLFPLCISEEVPPWCFSTWRSHCPHPDYAQWGRLSFPSACPSWPCWPCAPATGNTRWNHRWSSSGPEKPASPSRPGAASDTCDRKPTWKLIRIGAQESPVQDCLPAFLPKMVDSNIYHIFKSQKSEDVCNIMYFYITYNYPSQSGKKLFQSFTIIN